MNTPDATCIRKLRCKSWTGVLFPVLLAIMLSACTRSFEEINQDDTRVTSDQYKAEYSLTRAQLEYTGNSDYSYETWRVNIIYCGMMMQQLANTSWYAGDKYLRNDGWSSSYFDVAYRDQVKYVVDMLELTKDKPALWNLHQTGRIMRALIFQRLTDLYGDIPYTEAGLAYYDDIFAPKYDRQEVIYDDMLQELDEAAIALDPAKPMPGNGDLFYSTSSESCVKWKRLAYTLMLRLGMRLIKKDMSKAKYWVERAYAGGLFESNSDNAMVMHDLKGGRATVNRNSNILGGEWNATGWNRAANAKTEVFLSKTLIDYLKEHTDPRLGWMAQLRSNGAYQPDLQQGMPNGYDQNGNAHDISIAPGYPGSIENYSTIRGDIWLKLDGPTVIMSYAQSELLLAEAAAYGWQVGVSADMHYYRGVRAGMEQLRQYDAQAVINEAAISEFLAQNPLDLANPLPAIQHEYWLTCFMDWYECWSNWRRTGYPQLFSVNYPGNATQGNIPRRMLYPASESSVNAENYAAALLRQGPNDLMTRVWWDE